jgi:hypothetical protein
MMISSEETPSCPAVARGVNPGAQWRVDPAPSRDGAALFAGPPKEIQMRTHRYLLLALSLSLALVAAFLPQPSQAVGRCGNEWFFYSDATHTHQVGYEVYECNCAHAFTGMRTGYSVIHSLGC